MADTVGHSVLNNDYVKKHKLILGLPTYLKKNTTSTFIFLISCVLLYIPRTSCVLYILRYMIRQTIKYLQHTIK